MSAKMATRRPRRSLVVLASAGSQWEEPARALTQSLEQLGVEATYLGEQDDAQAIAAAVVDHRADGVDLCLTGGRGVLMLRELLRALVDLGRSDVSIVVHRLN
jgi:methylmalonyl-CoA mutase cobalamin-binding subunit